MMPELGEKEERMILGRNQVVMEQIFRLSSDYRACVLCRVICCTVVFLVLFTGCIAVKTAKDNTWTVSEQDTVHLFDPLKNIGYHLSGTVFKAIDPRYLANRHGILTVFDDSDKKSSMDFSLLTEGKTRNIVPTGNNYEIPPDVGSLWKYYINDAWMVWYQRIIPCTLMPHAVEKIEYLTAEQCKDTLDRVNITVRNIEHGISSGKSTLYLLDDIAVTEKIFEAIDLVYIRSLLRITDKDGIAAYCNKIKCNNKKIKEVVDLKTFKRKDVVYPSIVFGDSHWGYEVNGILFNGDTFDALKPNFFKTYKNMPASKEKYPGKARIISVTL
jgi:hypothetical protein